MNWKWALFRFHGRMNRKPFWMWSVGFGFFVLLGVLSVSRLSGPPYSVMGEGADAVFLWNLAAVVPLGFVLLAYIWVTTALGIKRLHDRNLPAWHYLFMLVPFLNFWIALQIAIVRGSDGPNQYGPDPLGNQSGDGPGDAAGLEN